MERVKATNCSPKLANPRPGVDISLVKPKRARHHFALASG
jgi:hypothetical protein